MSHMYRRCSKCGATQVSNPELRMHRFPALSKNNENYSQLLSWATFCFPEKDWSDLKAIDSLYKSSKVICSSHFADTAYTSTAKIRLQKGAVPCSNENLHGPIAGPSCDYNPNILEVHGESKPEQPNMPTGSLKTQHKQAVPCSNENLHEPIAGPSHDYNPNILEVRGESKPEQPNMPTGSIKTQHIKTNKRQSLSDFERKSYVKCKYLLKKVAQLKTALKQKKSADVLQMLNENENVTKLLMQKISPSMALMLQGELQNGQRKLKGRRWNEENKFLALELFKKSPRTYKLLSRLFCLPSPSSLKRLLGHFILKPGINKTIFENLKKNSERNTDNVCFLTFDEMSIMKNIRYNSKADEIEGYQDHGNQGKSKVFASHALVFMLVWVRRMRKQPVAFYLSGDYVTADRLTVLIKEVLHECLKAEMKVCATVCDMDGVNVRALENLGSSVDHPYFEFEGNEIITLPDPPHLLKCFRNLFMKYDVKLSVSVQSTTTGTTGKGVASWKHIKQFFELDSSNPHFVFAPKLSQRHIEPNGKEKMRVKLAAQIFSHSVAMGIYSKASTGELPAGAVATATFLENMNNLFDLLNANAADREHGKPYKTNWTARSPHKDYIKTSKNFLRELEFIGCTRAPPSKMGWLKLLNGYERLWDNLNKIHQIKTIATRRINQDALENFFGCVRANCGSNDNPTVAQFVAGLKTAMITNLRNVISNNKNCEADDNELLENYRNLFSKTNKKYVTDAGPANADPETNVSQQEISVSEEEIETSAETQACAYVCGYIFKKYSKNCELCKKAMLAENPTGLHQFVEFKEYVQGKHSLQYANHKFVSCVENSAEVVTNYLKESPHSDHLKKKCIELISEKIDFSFLNVCLEHLHENMKMIKQSTALILINRYCILENRSFASEFAKKRLLKKIKILKNS